MQKIVVRCIAIALVLSPGCAGEGTKNGLNPNGDSELSLLMREMFDDGMTVKQMLLAGQPPLIRCAYTDIHTAEATQPEKVATEEFKVFARAYEVSATELLASPPHQRTDAYQAMVNACMNCHKAVCPGPMTKIRKMYLSEDEQQALSMRIE